MRRTHLDAEAQGLLFRWQKFICDVAGVPFEEDIWHWSRKAEYPWAWRTGFIRGDVFDVGSSPQWLLALLSEETVTSVTAHFTHADTHRIPYMGWGENHVEMAQVYAQFAERLAFVWAVPSLFPRLLRPSSFDVVTSLSVVEHLPPADFEEWLEEPWRLVKPGGHMILTVDHFLTEQACAYRSPKPHEWIWNHYLWESIVARLPGAQLVAGEPREIPGHPDFDPGAMKDVDLLALRMTESGPLLGVYGLVLKKRP